MSRYRDEDHCSLSVLGGDEFWEADLERLSRVLAVDVLLEPKYYKLMARDWLRELAYMGCLEVPWKVCLQISHWIV